MKKTMLLAAAALVALCGSAMAKAVTVQLTNYCDEYTLNNTGAEYAILSDSTTCDPGLGGGFEGGVKKSGKLIITGMILNSSATEQWVWTFTAPLKSGGTATLYETTDGTTLNYVTSSPYDVVTDGSRGKSNLKPATQAH